MGRKIAPAPLRLNQTLQERRETFLACILFEKHLHKTALLNVLSAPPHAELFLPTPHKAAAYVSLVTRAGTPPAPPPHPSVQGGANHPRPQRSARLKAAWWEERIELKVCQSRQR